MRRSEKLVAVAAALVMLLTLSASPANAQSTGFFGGAGGEDTMTQMAPMLNMMKAKMGKKRFAALMQTMGPMMSQMMQNGGSTRIGGFNGMGSDFGSYFGGSMGGMDMGSMMGMIAPMMQMANFGGSGRHRHHRHRQ